MARASEGQSVGGKIIASVVVVSLGLSDACFARSSLQCILAEYARRVLVSLWRKGGVRQLWHLIPVMRRCSLVECNKKRLVDEARRPSCDVRGWPEGRPNGFRAHEAS